MATATDIVPLQKFLKDTSKPALEYLDGVIRRKSMPTTPHGVLQMLLGFLLYRAGWTSGSEIRVQLSATRYLVPDVIAGKRLEVPYPMDPVPLCVEILSPDDRMSDVVAKCEEYRDWGVPCCWILDPVRELAWEFHMDGSLHEIGPGGMLRAEEIEISRDELFSELRRGLA